jgi:hypothetical protein
MTSKKKDDLPYFPFYIGDWRKATDVQALPFATKAIWFEMLCYMWESTERGYLTVNNKPIEMESLARMLGIDKVLLEQNVKCILDFGVASIRESDGAIYSRKMVRDQEIRIIRQKSGSAGGKASFASRFAKANIQANTEDENDNEIKNKTISIEDEKMINDLDAHLLKWWGKQGRMGWGVMTQFVDLVKIYGETEVFKAIEDAAGHSACSLAYVKGILEKKGVKKAGEPKLKRVGEK